MVVRRFAALILVVAVAWLGGAVLAGEAAATAPTPEKAPAGKALTLEDAIGLALRNNPSVEIANQQIKENVGVVTQATSAAFPKVNVTTTRTTPVNQPAFSFQGQGISWETSFSLTQILYSWGAVGKVMEAARELLDSSRGVYVRTQDQVAFATRQVYYGVLSAQEGVKVQYEILAAAQEQQRIARLRQEAGIAPLYDVLSAEARVARVQQQVATAEGSLNIAWANLSRTLGCEVATDTVLTSTRLETAKEAILPELVRSAQANRPDVKAAEALVTANEARLAAVRVGKRPALSGIISYSLLPQATVSIDSGTEITVSQNSGFVALAANWDLYDGGFVFGQTVSAEARLEQSRQALRQLQLEVESQVKNSYYAIETTKAQIIAAQKEVEQATEAKRIADVRYREGVSTSVEVLDAQQTLGDAKNRLNLAIFNFNVALAELDLAAGRSLTQALPPGPRKQ